MDILNIYCLPISGGAFVAQIALLIEIYEAKKLFNRGMLKGKKSYAPDLVLAASGGNVAAYMGLAGGWTTEGILRCAREIDPKCFSRKWVPENFTVVPNILIALAKGSLYKQGYGANFLFSKFFTSESITDVEIWTGTYNNDAKSSQFFCNKSQRESLINEVFFNEEQFLYDSLPLKFMNGNVDFIAEVAIASASIPLVVPNQKIKNNNYADGGVSFPSPISVFASEIYRICINETKISRDLKIFFEDNTIKEEFFQNAINTIRENKTYCLNTSGTNTKSGTNSEEIITIRNKKSKTLRMVYFFPYQPDRIHRKKESELQKDLDAFEEVLHSAMIQDRNKAVDLIYRLCSTRDVISSFFPEVTTVQLANLLEYLSTKKHYLIVLHPHGDPSIKLTEFTPTEIIDKIEHVRFNYGAQVWYSRT